MTRKNAMDIALKLVLESDLSEAEKKDVAAHIKVSLARMEQIRWDRKSILAYCDAVMETKGSVEKTDFNHSGQPYKLAIRRAFNQTLLQFLDTYYPLPTGFSRASPYREKTREEWTEAFVQECRRLGTLNCEEYTQKHNRELPGWKAIAAMNQVATWTELIESVGLKSDDTSYVVTKDSPSWRELRALRQK